ncbi:translation initiation factor IF-2-like, partial [Frankliniella occidentalis]|uniref:Translation initiation factor IF-2-like n=1 Tax=Frankliniella occidentalis TaxID=133901 RepID=A0A9C6XD07_FRAOC
MSLQTPPSQRRPLARQASEDLKDLKDLKDMKDLWGRSSPRPAQGGRQGVRNTSRPASGGHQPRRSSASPMRPRPVRLAWAASPTPSPAAGSPAPSELVAKRCPSVQPPPPRPPPASASVLPSRCGAMSMSRQQLAERLRRAWQDRRPSLDIFLASTEPHEDDDDDALSLISARSALGDEPLVQPAPRPAPSPRTPSAGATGRGRGRGVLRPRGSMASPGPSPTVPVRSLGQACPQ